MESAPPCGALVLEWPDDRRAVSPERQAVPSFAKGGESLGRLRFRRAPGDCGRRVAEGGGCVLRDAQEGPT